MMEGSKTAFVLSRNVVWYGLMVFFTATCLSLPYFGYIDTYGYILLSLLLALFVEYLAIIRYVPEQTKSIERFTYVAVGIIAIVFLGAKPLFSTDVYRYIWDGGLSVHGINPYIIKPIDVTEPALLLSGLLAYQGFPTEYTIYPPLAQGIFAISYCLYSLLGLPGAKAVFALPLFLLWILMRKHLAPKFQILFILNPLLLFEGFNGAHVDFWAILFLVYAWYSLNKKSYTLSALALSAAVLTKIYPMIFVPLFAWHIYKNSNIKNAARFSFLCGGIIMLAYLPLINHLAFIIERYRAWVSDMQFNAALYSIFKNVFSYLVHNPVQWAQWASAGCIVILITALTRVRLTAAVMVATAVVFLSFSSVVYPWYTAVLVPFVFLLQDSRQSKTLLYLLALFQALVTSTYINEVVYTATLHGSNAINAISILEYTFLYGVISWYVVSQCAQAKKAKN